MALDFPNSPVLNETFTAAGRTWKFDGSKWNLEQASGITIDSLDDIADVVITGAISGEVLKFDGTNWINDTDNAGTSINSLDDIGDVVITAAEEFQSLIFDGTNWINKHSSTVTYVRNAESTTLTTGTVVYLSGATGDHATVKRADNNSDVTSSKTIGLIAANIPASENGPVITRGYVDGINLSVGYTAGDVLWLGENGAFTTTKPTAPDHLVFVGVVVRATNNGIIYVATQNGYEIDELHDVSIVDKTSGDFLKYNGSLWVNDQINLGTDTVGSYVESLVAGTGITLSNNSGESATPTIAIGQAVGTTDNVTFAGVTADQLTIGVLSGGNISTVSGNTNISIQPAATSGENVTAGQLNLAGSTATGTGSILGGGALLVGGSAIATSGDADGGLVNITGGDATSPDGISTGGSVSINSGTGSVNNGVINIGRAHTTSILIGTNDGTTTVEGAVVLYGDLTVNGTTTTINTTTLNVSDNIVVLNNDVTGTPTQNAGIEVERGTSANVLIRWNEVNDKWELTNDGTTYGNIATGQEVETTSSVTFGSVFTPILGQNGSNLDINATNVTINTGANLYDDNGTVTIGGSLSVTGAINGVLSVGTRAIVFEGDTDDAYETEIYAADPTADRTITFPDKTGTVALDGTVAIGVSDTAPTSPSTGQLWYESSTGSTFVYSGSAWVEVGVGQGPYVCTSSSRPSSPYAGQAIYETDTNKVLYWTGSAWYPSWNTAWGYVASGTMAATTSYTTDLEIISLSFSAVANRRYRYTVSGLLNVNSSGTSIPQITTAAGTILRECITSGAASTPYISPSFTHIETASSTGTLTRTVRTGVSSGSFTFYGANTRDSVAWKLIVEDIGPA